MDILMLLFVTIGYGFLGFLDDYLKITRKQNLGLTAKQKLFGQLIIGVVLYFALIQIGHPTVIHIPGIDFSIELGWLYLPFIVFITVGASNAVNITDGLDGLLAGTSAVAFGAFAIIAWAGS
ncbi:MAG: phospho-N-acetylmuramoyl-pentapeptide-transferase, partial [Bacilli bacterium]